MRAKINIRANSLASKLVPFEFWREGMKEKTLRRVRTQHALSRDPGTWEHRLTSRYGTEFRVKFQRLLPVSF